MAPEREEERVNKSGYTLAGPEGLKELRIGDRFDWYERPLWYVRAWRWFRRVVLRRPDPPPPPPCRITRIDYETRTVTYDGVEP